MNSVDQAADLVAKMSAAEKAQLLQVLVGEAGGAHPGIETRSDPCGGEPCIANTRIPVWILEQARRLSASEADLLRFYPTLRAADLVNAWAYVGQHRQEIDVQTKEVI
jgi:uncharacterized protein (DUF433 family)